MKRELKPWMITLAEGEAERRRVADIERLIRWYFATCDAAMALWVAWNSSGLDPLAYHRNGGGGVGLFAINPEDVGLSPADEWLLQNPIRNVAYAHRLYARYGWEHWKIGLIPALWLEAANGTKEAYWPSSPGSSSVWMGGSLTWSRG
jgi:hypothetical protein